MIIFYNFHRNMSFNTYFNRKEENWMLTQFAACLSFVYSISCLFTHCFPPFFYLFDACCLLSYLFVSLSSTSCILLLYSPSSSSPQPSLTRWGVENDRLVVEFSSEAPPCGKTLLPDTWTGIAANFVLSVDSNGWTDCWAEPSMLTMKEPKSGTLSETAWFFADSAGPSSISWVSSGFHHWF